MDTLMHLLSLTSCVAILAAWTPAPADEAGRPLEDMGHRVRDVVFSTEGRLVAVSDARFCLDGTRASSLRIWDATTGRVVRTLMEERDIKFVPPSRALAFSPDGLKLASVGPLLCADPTPGAPRPLKTWSGGKLRLWDVERGRLLEEVKDPGPVFQAVTFGKTIACIDEGWRLHEYRGDAGKELACITPRGASPKDYPSSLTASIASFDRAARRAVAIVGRRKTIPGPAPVILALWDADRPSARYLDLRDTSPDAVAIDPDGLRFAVADFDSQSHNVPMDQQVLVRDFGSGEVVQEMEKTDIGQPLLIRFSPDGTRLVAGDEKDNIDVWDAHTARHVRRIQGPSGLVPRAIVFLDGRVRVASGGNGLLRGATADEPATWEPLVIWEAAIR